MLALGLEPIIINNHLEGDEVDPTCIISVETINGSEPSRWVCSLNLFFLFITLQPSVDGCTKSMSLAYRLSMGWIRFKAILALGLEPIIINNHLEGDEVHSTGVPRT